MAGFSIQDAAFSGFAAVRAHPRALGAWTLAAVGLSLALQFIVLPSAGVDLQAAILSHDPARLSGAFDRLLPVELEAFAASLVVGCVMQAGIYRMVLIGGDDRLGYLRLGRDEARLLAVSVAVALIVTAVTFLAAIGFGVVVGIVVGLAHLPLVPAQLLATAAALGLAALVLVRLSLTPVATFAEGRIDLAAAWRLTRAHAWALLGTYLLVGALCVVVYTVAFVLIYGLGGVVLGPSLAELADPPASPAAVFAPLRLILTVFWAFLSALVWPVMLAPAAVIYRSLGRGLG